MNGQSPFAEFVIGPAMSGRIRSLAGQGDGSKSKLTFRYGIRIEEPVVLRPSRSLCALTASLSAYF